MEVNFFGTYNKETFLEAHQLAEKRSTFNIIFRYAALGLSILIISWTVYGMVVDGIDPSEIGSVLRNLVTALVIGYYYFSGWIVRNRSITRLFRSGPKRTMQGNVNLEGVTLGTPQQNALIKWDRFVSKGEKGQLFALMTVDGSLAVFHREFFATESDWQRFRLLANQRVIEPK